MKPYHHHEYRMKTPTLDNEKQCFCFFVFQHPKHQHHQHHQHSHPQYHHHHYHYEHSDVKASEGQPWSDNHSEINNNIGESNHDSINAQYIIERRKAELNFKRSQDAIKAKDCTRNPLLEIDDTEYYEAKEVTSLHNWKSSNIDGQHKYPAPSAPPGVFEDMNQMFHRVGIRFSNNHYERYSYHTDSNKDDVNIEAVGDAHLQRLHLACVEKMLKLDFDSDIKGTDSLSKLDNMMTPVTSSLVTPFLGSSQDIHESIQSEYTTSNQCYQLIEVVSVALAYSEVLQLQGQTDKAVLVVEDAIEKLKKDMKDIEESNVDNNISYNWDVLDPNSEITAKKIDLLLESHKRLGPLYKVMGDFENAEKHIRWFISLAENKSDKITDLAHAYSLLAVIFDGLDRLDDAFEADTRALELLETIKVLQRERDLKLNY